MSEPLNVLIIEDLEEDAKLVLRELRRAGFDLFWQRIQTANALQTALMNQPWDVIISDYRLPGFDAPAALAIVKSSQLDIPFIVVSGTIGDTAAVELMKAGAHDYLMKDNLVRLPEAVRRELRDAQIRAERQRATAELDQAKERLQLAIEGSGIALWDWSIQSGALTVNDRWAWMMGYTLQELEPISNKTWVSYTHPKDLQRANEVLEQHFQGAIQEYECELRMRHKLGQWVWVLTRGKVVEWDSAGQPLRMTGTHLDITARKQAESLLELQNIILERIATAKPLSEILDALVHKIEEQLGEGICSILLCDAEGKLHHGAAPHLPLAYSQALEGASIGEQAGSCGTAAFRRKTVIVSDIASDPLWQDYKALALPHGLRACWSVPVISSTGEVIATFATYYDKVREPQPQELEIITLAANIAKIAIEREQSAQAIEQLNRELELRVEQRTAALQASEIQLQHTNAELARATRLKDEFLANMSHELRTPLNAVLGMSEGLQDKVFGSLNAEQVRAIATIERSGRHLLELINDILDLSKIEAGKLELNLEDVPVQNLCNTSLTFVKQSALKKQITLNLEIPSGLNKLTIRVDDRRLCQVLINLLSNAVKFTPEGGNVSLTVRMEENTGAQSYYSAEGIPALALLCFAVTDTGIGIAQEHLGKLFQPFTQIDSSLNRQYAGTGLGLALVKQITELHGGNVSVVSTIGQGSCFTVRLPYTGNLSNSNHTLAPSSDLPEVVSAGGAGQTIRPFRILLAEDNEANVLTLAGYLQAKGHEVLLASNGQEAVDQAQVHQPDLILMDIQMPGMDGLEAIQRIRRVPRLAKIPIVALTALAMAGDRERCLAAGANDYLTKPVRLKQLAETIQQLLSSPGLPSSL